MANGNGAVRILVAGGQSLFREAVRTVLEGQEDLAVVALAADGVQAVAEAEQRRPNLALIDLQLPNPDGIRATALIRRRVPDCRVLLLADEDEDTPTLVEAIEAGANGFLSKGCPVAELIEAARSIYRGDTLVPAHRLGDVLAALVDRGRERDGAIRRMASLTRREKEVLGLLVEGADNDTIAQVLVISPQTARTHVHNLLTKLGLRSRVEAAAFVLRNRVGNELGVPVE